jgi:hypothetical protein
MDAAGRGRGRAVVNGTAEAGKIVTIVDARLMAGFPQNFRIQSLRLATATLTY